jgi:cystathionine beta-lyase/cystathionine gamma-synthase
VRFDTLAARGAREVPSATRPLAPPLYQASVFVFDSLEQVESVWEGKAPGFVYGRYGTPNHAMLEALVAALEGGEAAVACASGMGAITSLLLATLRPGEHLLAARDLYGSTTALFAEEVARWGIEVSFAEAPGPEAVRAALTPRTRAVFVEAISNPLLRLADIEALAGALRPRGVTLVVDATFASPAVLRPLALGADVVLHSATKFLSGHGDVTAGLVVGRRELVERVRATMIRVGANASPFDCWLTARGLRTLHVRLERQCRSALALARALEKHPAVARVHYPGLPSHPGHGLAARLFANGAGAVLSFELAGGEAAVGRMMERLALIEFAPSFGDAATTWSYPARTSHRRLSEAARAAAGIGPGLVRLSVGLEAVEDLEADLARALG